MALGGWKDQYKSRASFFKPSVPAAQLKRTAMGRLRIALLPLALVLVLVNLPSSSSAPGKGLLRRAWDFEVDLWRQAFDQVEEDRRAEMRQARF